MFNFKKSRFLQAFLALPLLTAGIAVAQQPQQAQPFNADQKQQAQEQLRQLGEVFGVPRPTKAAASNNPATTTTPEEPKTIASVADRALDMVGNAVASISSMVQKVAPEIWRIMIRQQYANAVECVAIPFGFLLTLLTYKFYVNKHWQPSGAQNEWENELIWRRWLVQILPTGAMLLTGCGLVIGLTQAFQIWINPEYYAVRDLLQTLLKSSPQ